MKFYITGLVSLLIIISGFSLVDFSETENEASPPNIVFLFSDDHSVPDVGAYGNSVIHTPNLDRLADEGMLFNRAYVTASQCSPSRASIFTGRSPHAVGASRLHIDAQPEFPSIIEMLNDNGYYTGAYRKVHQGHIKQQFDFYGGRNKEIRAFFDSRPTDKPFFLGFYTRDPHRPYNTGSYEYEHDPDEITVPDYLPDTKDVRQDLANYYNEITRFDRESGEILELLEEQGVAGNTIVVMAGDNGMPFPRAKAFLYEAGIKVPLIIKWPGTVEAGSVTDELVSLMDLTATWLEAAGIPVPEEMEGRSLIPLFNGDLSNSREYVFAERNWHDNWDPMRAVVGERYKLIHNYRPGTRHLSTLDRLFSPTWQAYEDLKERGELNEKLQWYFEPKPRIEFYDLEEDPGEWNNLADNPKYDSLIREYQGILGQWMNETHDFLPAPRDAFPSGGHEFNKKYDPLNAEEL